MIAIIQKLFFFFCLMVASWLPQSSYAADVWTPGYVWDAAGNTGRDVWFGPGNKITTNGAFARGANVTAAANGFNVAETGAVLLRDGRAVSLTASRFLAVGEVAAATVRLAGGPVGIAAVLAIPYVYDWITADNGVNIRVRPDRLAVEKKDGSVCSVAPCYAYRYAAQNTGTIYSGFKNLGGSDGACASYAQTYTAVAPSQVTVTGTVAPTTCNLHFASKTTGQSFGDGTFSVERYTVTPSSEAWLPASMDDIAPYMSARLPSTLTPKALVDAGAELTVTPTAITGPSPALPTVTPFVQTTTYPAPADKTSTTRAFGNIFNLPDALAHNTDVTTGVADLNPGPTTTTGALSFGAEAPPAPGPIKTKTTSTTSSQYDPVTNQTTTTTNVTQDGAIIRKTVTSGTTFANSPTESVATTTSGTTTEVTNTTTGQVTTSTGTTDGASKTPSECDVHPERIGCSEYGTPPAPEVMSKKTTAVTVTAAAFSSSSSCPSPLSFSVVGHSYQVSYSPICDRLAVLKFVFLAMAAFIAAYILAGSFKV